MVYVNSLYYKWWTKTNFFLIHYNLEHLSLILTFHSVWTTVRSLYSTSLKITYLRKKQGASTLCNSMDGTGEHYAKWNKPGSERQIPYDLTYKGNLINKTSKQNITRDIEIKNKLTVARGEVGVRQWGNEGEESRNMYKGPMHKAKGGKWWQENGDKYLKNNKINK